MPSASRRKGKNGSTSGENFPAEGGPLNSENSTAPTNGSKKHWRTPKNLRELATQINQVATLVLNDQIDLEHARAFGALTRNVAQLLSTEFHKGQSQASGFGNEF